MSRHVRLSKLTIFPQSGRAYSISRATVKAAAERYNLLSPRSHASHTHGILVRLSSRIAEEAARQSRRSKRDQLFSRTRALLGINKIRIEEKLLRLLNNGSDDMRVTAACSSDRDAAVQIKKFLAIARVNPHARARFGSNRHLLVSRQLEAVFQRFNRIKS